MERAELVFITLPGLGHAVPAVEIAKQLTDRDQRLSITLLIMKAPFDERGSAYIDSLAGRPGNPRIRFLIVPQHHYLAQLCSSPPPNFFALYMDCYKARIRESLVKLMNGRQCDSDSNSVRFAGFILNMFCTSMREIAEEFGVPYYVFFTSAAAILGLLLHIQVLHDKHDQDLTKLKESDAQLAVPSFANPFPATYLPAMSGGDGGTSSPLLVELARSLREAKGIMVNSFVELESYAINSLVADATLPPIYAVGPVLNLKGHGDGENEEIMAWLDRQPASSVVFLCFGSKGSFGAEQVREIANELERSGQRFLWCVRQPPPKGKFAVPSDYANVADVLPEGFVDRTAETGRVMGWAPQVAVLSHPAVGGFVSHCGWNSILESVWCGVPIAAWPMYAEQQANAFLMVRELGLGAEMSLNYRNDFMTEASAVIGGGDIERGIRCVMEQGSEVREKVKSLREKSRKAVREGGSSYSSLGLFIEQLMLKAES